MVASVTTVLIASVVGVSVLAWLSKSVMGALILRPTRVRERSEVHRLLTAGWVHADVTHLLFNMLTLYSFSAGVERVMGPVVFGLSYVSAVVVSFVPSTLRRMHDPRYA